MYLGKIGLNDCLMSNNAPNSSILISGVSGSGKTTRMLQIELTASINKNTVIVIDTAHSHSQKEIQKLASDNYLQNACRISALSDGLNLKFLEPFNRISNQLSESDYNIVKAATRCFSQPLKLGVSQTAVLRESIIFALHHREKYDTEIQAIVAGLNQKGKQGHEVYHRLWDIFCCGALRTGSHQMIQPCKINIIDLNDFENDVQKVLAEIILSYFWRKIRYGNCPKNHSFNIFLDECQRFSLDQQGCICELLREGRKFNINLVFSAQSLSIFKKDTQAMLHQASTELYFKPAQEDISYIAKKLSPADWRIWKTRLANLNVGECIASGLFNINGLDINRPLLLH